MLRLSRFSTHFQVYVQNNFTSLCTARQLPRNFQSNTESISASTSRNQQLVVHLFRVTQGTQLAAQDRFAGVEVVATQPVEMFAG